MAKARVVYVCDSCGNESLQWLGVCPACKAVDSFKSLTVAKPGPARTGLAPASAQVRSMAEVLTGEESRLNTGIDELDRVLGGGLMTGSVTLLGGDPGIGKSTLLLQAGEALSRAAATLYVSGEESLRQV